MSRLYAVRGATTVTRDAREEILERTRALLEELRDRNAIEPMDVVSILFTATGDLHAAFPAEAAPLAGLPDAPRTCARELDVDGDHAVPKCIRVLLHYYGDRPPEPVYLEGAVRILDHLERPS